jgi:ribosomal subunit interface protein
MLPTLPIQLVFRDVAATSPALAEHIRAKADKLTRFYEPILGCRVVVSAPHRQKTHGGHYRVRVDVVVPGGEIVKTSEKSRACEDAHAAVDEAFEATERALKAFAERQRFERDSKDGSRSLASAGASTALDDRDGAPTVRPGLEVAS